MRIYRTSPKKTLFCLCVFILIGCHGQGQVDYGHDSTRVLNAEWSIDTLDGFLLKKYRFGEGGLFCSAQYLFVIEIPPTSDRRLSFAADSLRNTVSEIAAKRDAKAAVNGSFFDMRYGNPVCYLRIDGQQRGENTPQKTDTVNRKYYQYATIVLRKGRPVFLTPDSNRHWESTLADSNIMTAGPMLLHEGKEVPQRSDLRFVRGRHARTALGLKEDGTTIILVADGHFKNLSEGLSLFELQRLMRWMGCREAINLDGGGSTTLYVQGKKHEGVVNYPADNRTHDHEGQRPVANAIVVL